MKINGEERMNAAPDRVWQALNEPQVLQQCIPGCQSLDRESTERLRAIVEIKVGPIGARFNSIVTLCDVRPLQGYTLIGEGQGGMVGSAKATIVVRLENDGAGTRLLYDVDAQVAGRLAQLGGPIIDATAKQFAARFFGRFREIIGGAPEAARTAAVHEAPQDVAAHPVAASVPLTTARSSDSLPYAWILAVVVAALVGFLVGRGEGRTSDWMGLAIGLLVLVVAAVGVEYGRRIAAPQIIVDPAVLARLLRGDRQ